MQQLNQCLFISFSLSRSVCQSPPAFQALVPTGLPCEASGTRWDTHTHKLLRSDCYSCKWLWTLVFFLAWSGRGRGREGEWVSEWESEKGMDKLQASTSEQPHSTGLIMAFKGVSVLLGVLLLVNCSLEQNPLKKRVVKKGRKHHNLQEEGQIIWILYFCYEFEILLSNWIFSFFFKQHAFFIIMCSYFNQESILLFVRSACTNTYVWILCLVLLVTETTKDAAVEQLQKQIDNIVQELNLLKEQQALQTGKLLFWTAGSNLILFMFCHKSLNKALLPSGNWEQKFFQSTDVCYILLCNFVRPNLDLKVQLGSICIRWQKWNIISITLPS